MANTMREFNTTAVPLHRAQSKYFVPIRDRIDKIQQAKRDKEECLRRSVLNLPGRLFAISEDSKVISLVNQRHYCPIIRHHYDGTWVTEYQPTRHD